MEVRLMGSTKAFHEVLVLQRKDSHGTVIQHNKGMLLDEENPVEDAASQVDWDGDIWPSWRVLAIFVFRPRDRYYAIAVRDDEAEDGFRYLVSMPG
jgi:hypothetical protein